VSGRFGTAVRPGTKPHGFVTPIPVAEQIHPAAFAQQVAGVLSIFAGVSRNPCFLETWIDLEAFFSRLPILPGRANPSLECRE
jgi:hypothetical protein